MFFKATSKQKEELVLVFDIGSYSVGGALFFTQASGIPKIILSVRENILFKESIDVNKFLSSTLQALKVVANKIHDAKKGVPKRIFCILSSPWYVSETRIISLEKNTPFIFTSKLADSLIQKEVTLFEEERLAKYVHGGGVRTIELKSIQTSLNGYATLSPIDKEAKMLEITLFVSVSPEEVLQKIEESIKRYFHTETISFSSAVFSSFVVVRDLYINQKNFLLIDIGGELTNIAMVKKDILRESISYPFGTNFITRETALGLSCTLDEARSFLSLYKDGNASPQVLAKLEKVLTQVRTDWLKKFQESLASLSNDISIPATVFIIVEKGWATFFTELIKKEQFNQYILTESKFEITFLGTEELHGLASFEDGVNRDAQLITPAIYINRYMI